MAGCVRGTDRAGPNADAQKHMMCSKYRYRTDDGLHCDSPHTTMERKHIKALAKRIYNKGWGLLPSVIPIHHLLFQFTCGAHIFPRTKQNRTHLGVEAVAKLGDAAGDLVEVDRLLAAVPLDDVHLAHGWKLLVPMQ